MEYLKVPDGKKVNEKEMVAIDDEEPIKVQPEPEESPAPPEEKYENPWTNRELFARQAIRPRHYLKVRVAQPLEVIGVDLMDMNQIKKDNDNYPYLFVAVDVFTRFVWAKLIKDKSAKTMVECFKELFNTDFMPGQKFIAPRIWVDQESGIMSTQCKKYLQDNNVTTYHTYSDPGSVFAENAIKKIKKLCFKKIYDTLGGKQGQRWIDDIDEYIKQINDTPIKTTGLSPNDMKKPENLDAVRNTFYDDIGTKKDLSYHEKKVLNVGDRVHITQDKGILNYKGYDPFFTAEVFVIKKKSIIDGIPIYYIKDLKGEDIIGHFYANELRKDITEGEGIWDNIKGFFNGLFGILRTNLPPASRALLEKIGNRPIQSLAVGRRPIAEMIGKLVKYLKKDKVPSHDTLFHLFFVAVIDGQPYRYEKNEDVGIVPHSQDPKDEYVNMDIPSNLTLNIMIANTIKDIGTRRYFHYNAFDTNCQRFVMDNLNANRIFPNQYKKDFIFQDVSGLIPHWLEKFSVTLTDLKSNLNQMIDGEGLA